MTLETIIRLKRNPDYLRYIRENSYWYKMLNRNPNLFSQFEEEVKQTYGLRKIDKINKTLDMIEMVEKIITTMK